MPESKKMKNCTQSPSIDSAQEASIQMTDIETTDPIEEEEKEGEENTMPR